MGLILCVLLAMASVTPWAENIWAFFWPDAAGMTRCAPPASITSSCWTHSLSMNQGNDSTLPSTGPAQLAIRKIKDAPAGDGFSILLMKEHPIWIIGETLRRRIAARRPAN